MRTVFLGAGKVSVETAKALIKKGHEVIIIENDKARIDALSEEIDGGGGVAQIPDEIEIHAGQ